MLSLALLAALAVKSLVVAACPADSVRPEPVILETRIGDLAYTTVAALRVGDAALLPIAQVLALAELPPANDSTGYVSADSLSVLLKTSIAVDWDELIVTIADDGSLPVSQRIAREQRLAQFDALRTQSLTQTAAQAEMTILPHDLIFDYTIGAVGSPRSVDPSVRVGLGTTLLGGAVDVDWTRTPSFGQSTFLWQRSWIEKPLLRDVRVGMVPLAGMVMGQGVYISSQLPNRDDATTPIVLSGNTAPGWQLEVYRDDILIYTGLADSTGRYSIAVPSFRGINRLVVVAYGARGEKRTTTRYVTIGDSMIRRGTGAFDLAFGRCADADCSYAAQLDLRYAPFTSVTVGAGIGSLYNRGNPLLEPSALVAFRLHDDINAGIHTNSRGTVIQA
ncbi:MAG: hypothetical protein ACHQQP_06540, partial [Gemmatimonadales bacterium]